MKVTALLAIACFGLGFVVFDQAHALHNLVDQFNIEKKAVDEYYAQLEGCKAKQAEIAEESMHYRTLLEQQLPALYDNLRKSTDAIEKLENCGHTYINPHPCMDSLNFDKLITENKTLTAK